MRFVERHAYSDCKGQNLSMFTVTSKPAEAEDNAKSDTPSKIGLKKEGVEEKEGMEKKEEKTEEGIGLLCTVCTGRLMCSRSKVLVAVSLFIDRLIH